MVTGSCAVNNCSNPASLGSTSVCYYETTSFLGKICMPSAAALKTFSSTATDAINSLVNSSTLTQWLNDISSARYVIAISVGIAFGLGFAYMIFLRLFAGLLVWCAIILYFAAIIVLGYLSYKKSTDIKDYLSANNNVESGNNTKDN